MYNAYGTALFKLQLLQQLLLLVQSWLSYKLAPAVRE